MFIAVTDLAQKIEENIEEVSGANWYGKRFYLFLGKG